MFSLILVVASIGLIIGLVFITMNYGGNETLDKGKIEAAAAQAVNEMNQIRTAIVTYQANQGEAPPSLEALTTSQYLSKIPDGWGTADPVSVPWADGLRIETRQLSADNEDRAALICDVINERLNQATPSCTALPASFMGCCVSD